MPAKAAPDTSVSQLTLAVLALLKHLAAAVSDPGLAEPLDLPGVTAESGAKVTFRLAAASRDPERYTDPDRLDLAHPDVAPCRSAAALTTAWAPTWVGSSHCLLHCAASPS
ncbi:hypothetical protein [Streptomyces niveiscabiei]|uniref:Uncharacterized protein n=1 Tax=Streptomyces niveiscabiei TaxID=164115 RepID=A0ABW9I777_9ACTN